MSQAVKIGIFMTICLIVLGYLIMKVEDWRFLGARGQRIEAEFDSVVGLDDRAAVRIAGVRVGRVDGVRLVGRKAHVSLLFDQRLPLTAGTEALVANQGLLGDKFVEITPGPDGAALLAEGAVIPGKTPISFDQAMGKIEEIGVSIQTAVDSLTGTGPSGGSGKGISDLVASLKATSDELRALIAENRANLSGTMKNFDKVSETLSEKLPSIADRLDKVLQGVDSILSENREDLHGTMSNLRDATTKVQTSLDNLSEITGKINRGEGTVGKLINSEEAHKELMNALGSVEKGVETLTNTIGRVQKLRLDLAIEADRLTKPDDARSAFRLDLYPRGDESLHLYRVELVSDPRGKISEKQETFTVTNPDGTTSVTTTDRLTTDKRTNAISAMVGFPFDDQRGRIWAGLKESTGGAEIDYGLWKRRLWLSLEAFDFSRPSNLNPHVRVTAKWNLFPALYLRAGYDDPLVRQYRGVFVGAGIRWTDDDLKYLLGSIPKF